MQPLLNESELYQIISNFRVDGGIASCQLFGSGHINDTFRLRNSDADRPDYLLQRINHEVFKDVPGLMQNLSIVTNHLKTKLPEARRELETLSIIPSQNGDLFHKDTNGNYWRMLLFLNDTHSYDLVTTEQQAFEGGKAFGKFQLMLSDLHSAQLVDTIPGFHDIELRLQQLSDAVERNKAGRLEEVTQELQFIHSRAEAMGTILAMGRKGDIPLRITHNDTKFNNVLLDKNDKAQCVVDLDTVMPGYVAYDFGDAVRTIINTAAEDEADLSRIQLNLPLFTTYVDGYFKQAKSFLTKKEVESLLHGVFMLPFIQAVRFLTDHLNGDIYFKISKPCHNMQRARAQMELVCKLEAAKDDLAAIIANHAGHNA